MFGFFDNVMNFFSMVWDFVTNLINSINTLLQVIVGAVTLPPFLVGFVPSVIGACITAVAAVAIAKLIVGWGNG